MKGKNDKYFLVITPNIPDLRNCYYFSSSERIKHPIFKDKFILGILKIKYITRKFWQFTS